MELAIGSVFEVVINTVLILLIFRLSKKRWMTVPNAFWTAFIPFTMSILPFFALGFVLANHLGVAAILGFVASVFFQALLIRLMARTANETVARWRAYLISIGIVAIDLLVVSPVVAMIIK